MNIHRVSLQFLSRSLLLAIFIIPANGHAQNVPRPFELPRVGSAIDAEAAEYFQLFPDITTYKSYWTSRIREDGLHIIPAGNRTATAKIVAAPDDSVRFYRTAIELNESDVRTISARAVTALERYLMRFEEIRTTYPPFALESSPFFPDSLGDAIDELIDSDIIPNSWSPEFQQSTPSLTSLIYKDGRKVRGYILGVTNNNLLFWTDGPCFDPAAMDSAFIMVPGKEIDSLVVEGAEHVTGLFAGLFASVMSVGQSSIGVSNKDPDGLWFQFGILTPVAMLLGAAISVPHDYALRWSTEQWDQFESSQIHDVMMTRPGLPPEVWSAMPFDTTEVLVRDPKDYLSLVPYPDQALLADDQEWSVGAEQLWLRADGLTGLRPGLSVGYKHVIFSFVDRIADLSIGIQVSGSNYYAAASSLAMARIGPFDFVAGVRGMWLPEDISTITTGASSIGSYSHTTTTTTNHARDFGQYLYSEFGVAVEFWDVSFGVRAIRQLTPSATVHSITIGKRINNPSEEIVSDQILDNMHFGAIALSMRYRF